MEQTFIATVVGTEFRAKLFANFSLKNIFASEDY